MAFNPTLMLADWSKFPGLYEKVLAALPNPEEFTVTEEKRVDRDNRPHKDWLPEEERERFAIVTVTVRVPLSGCE
jgi:hypothetical protein